MLAFGILLMAGSFSALPLILIAPHKFASVFTMGSLCILGSFAALKGFDALFSHLFSKVRLTFSLGYTGSIAGTIWASMWYQSTLLTMVFCGLQISGLVWFFVSYIPGGTMVLGWLQ